MPNQDQTIRGFRELDRVVTLLHVLENSFVHVVKASRHRPTCGRGEAPFWVLCDRVDNTSTEDAIGSNKQDLALRDGCFTMADMKFTFQIKPGKVFPNMGAPLFDCSSVASS